MAAKYTVFCARVIKEVCNPANRLSCKFRIVESASKHIKENHHIINLFINHLIIYFTEKVPGKGQVDGTKSWYGYNGKEVPNINFSYILVVRQPGKITK